MIDTTGSCATCRFWLSADSKAGICRRYPPTPFIIGFAQSPIHDPAKPQPGVPVTQSFFPQMMPQGYCGEHDTRKGH